MNYTFVKSNYASPWRGIILNEWKVYERYYIFFKREMNSICLVLLTHDKRGNKFNKRHLKVISKGWLEVIEPFDLSHIHKDWYLFDKNIDPRTADGWNYYQ